MEYKVNLITLYSVVFVTPIKGETVILAKVCPFSIEVELNVLINHQNFCWIHRKVIDLSVKRDTE